MATKKKAQKRKGLTYLIDEHEHLLVESIDKEVDEGTSVKILFTDTNGAKGFVRLAKKRWEKVSAEDNDD